MKTYNEITTKMHRASMRESALRYRILIHPVNFSYGSERRFVFNTEHAAASLENAIAYRDMAREAAR